MKRAATGELDRYWSLPAADVLERLQASPAGLAAVLALVAVAALYVTGAELTKRRFYAVEAARTALAA